MLACATVHAPREFRATVFGLGVGRCRLNEPVSFVRSANGADTRRAGSIGGRLRQALLPLLIVGVPALLAIGGMVGVESLSSQRAVLEARLMETARGSALAIDAQLQVYRTAAQVLARSPQARAGVMSASLYALARETGAAVGGWVTVSPADPQAVPILNTHLPLGASQEPPDGQTFAPELIRTRARALQTGQPQISDLFIGPHMGRPVVQMIAPVPASEPGGTPSLRVALTFEAEGLAKLLLRQHLDNGAYAAVSDSHHFIVARSFVNDTLIGKIGRFHDNPDFVGDGGVIEGAALSGRHVLVGFHDLANAPDWRVVVVEPFDGVAGMITPSILRLLLIGSAVPALMLLALGLMWLSGRDDRAAYAELDRILEKVPATIFVDRISPDGSRTRQFLSGSAGRHSGRPWRELRWDSERFIQDMDPADAESFLAYRERVHRTGAGSTEARVRHHDGGWRTLRYDETCFQRGRDGSMLVVGCIIDVSEESAMRQRLRQAERLAVLGEVATGIAHEVNQPLAVIAMAAENAVRALRGGAPRVLHALEKLRLIQSQVHRIGDVVHHIGIFSRADTREHGLVDVAEVVEAAMALLEGRLNEEGISVSCRIEPDLPRVRGVTVMLEQVLINIMVNAADAYRDQPDIAGRHLHIVARREEDDVCITIADRAGGIADDAMSRVFDPFFTTKPPGKGTGLGLSISFATIAEMGGKISVHNEDGGAVFRIELPGQED